MKQKSPFLPNQVRWKQRVLLMVYHLVSFTAFWWKQNLGQVCTDSHTFYTKGAEQMRVCDVRSWDVWPTKGRSTEDVKEKGDESKWAKAQGEQKGRCRDDEEEIEKSGHKALNWTLQFGWTLRGLLRCQLVMTATYLLPGRAVDNTEFAISGSSLIPLTLYSGGIRYSMTTIYKPAEHVLVIGQAETARRGLEERK